jgi:hypothetical protein
VLSKFSAVWLVVLILLPFTAPFPTCDIATFFGQKASDQGVPLGPPTSPAALVADAVSSLLFPPLERMARQVTQVALSNFNTPHIAVRSPLVILVPPLGSNDLAGTERVPSAILRL